MYAGNALLIIAEYERRNFYPISCWITGRRRSRHRYILEKYYGVTVVGMYIVCVHPDVGDEPFVDVVPDLGPQIEAMMADQRRRHADVRAPRCAGAVYTVRLVVLRRL